MCDLFVADVVSEILTKNIPVFISSYIGHIQVLTDNKQLAYDKCIEFLVLTCCILGSAEIKCYESSIRIRITLHSCVLY